MAVSTFFNFNAALRAPYAASGRCQPLTLAACGDYGYDNNFSLAWRNAAKTADINVLRLDTSDQIRVGPGYKAVKIFNRPTTGFTTTMTDAFALQVKSEFTATASGHACVEVTADCKSALAAGGGNIGVQGVSRLAATFTATGGSIIGTYGQACNLGTMNGSGIMMAGVYGLIEAGGTFTSVSHVAAGWFDSHRTQAISAGNSELLYLTNNGSGQIDSVFFVYPGNAITNLFTIDSTDTGLVSGETAGAATITNWRAITCSIHGATKYLIVGDIA